MTKISSITFILLPIIFGVTFAAVGVRNQPLVESEQQVSTLQNCLHEAMLNKEELEDQVEELSGALALAELDARRLQAELQRVQELLSDARDLAFVNLPVH